MCTGQWESRKVVVKGGGCPARGGVAAFTVRTVLPIMAVIILMAGMAVVGSTHENAIDMTALAGRVRVLTGQLESGQVVVECRWGPTGGGMAATAT